MYAIDRKLTREYAATIPGGSGVDDRVRSLNWGYDGLGRVANMTSTSGNGVGDVRDQIIYTHGTHGRIIETEQAHDDEVTGGTPSTQYAYDESVDGSNIYTNGLRQKSVTYPSGRVVHSTYGSSDSLADRLSRVDMLEDDSSGSPGIDLTQYAYNGTNRLVIADYPFPDVRLDVSAPRSTS